MDEDVDVNEEEEDLMVSCQSSRLHLSALISQLHSRTHTWSWF